MSSNNWDNWENEDDCDDWVAVEKKIPGSDNIQTKQAVVQESQRDIPDNEQAAKRQYSAPYDKQRETQEAANSWWSGLTSVLTTATEGLGNITSTVSQGINQVIDVSNPRESVSIATDEATTSQKTIQNDPELHRSNDQLKTSAAFGTSIVKGVTALGSKMINTGLDTLEDIGKKTMNILQESDPMLKNKRKLLGLEHNRPNLSEVLKEAKQDAEELESTLKELNITQMQLPQFEILFERKCGHVHFEALEILSEESERKIRTLLNSVSGKALIDLQETINEVKELMELEDIEAETDDDYTGEKLQEIFTTAIEELKLDITFEDLVNNWQNTLYWLETNDKAAAQNIFDQSINTLAETCALAMNKLHKIAELLLIKDHHSTASEVDSLVQLCHEFNLHLHGLTHLFARKLMALNDEDAKVYVKNLCGDLLLAEQKIKKALNLFLPIIQIGAA